MSFRGILWLMRRSSIDRLNSHEICAIIDDHRYLRGLYITRFEEAKSTSVMRKCSGEGTLVFVQYILPLIASHTQGSHTSSSPTSYWTQYVRRRRRISSACR
jgi:hypothetical protein